MPRINIHEHSDTYSWQTYEKSFGCVAFPITAIWGPVYDVSDEDSNPDWVRFEAGYRGTTDFVTMFRGANTALGAREKSYDYALKLLGSGYDILVKRADGLGRRSSATLVASNEGEKAQFTRTFSPGSPGGSGLQVVPGYQVASTAVTYTGRSSSAGTQGNYLKVRLVRTSEMTADPTKSFSGLVTLTMYVYKSTAPTESDVIDSMTDELVEKAYVSYTQSAATITDNPGGSDLDKIVTFGSDTVTVGSAYIDQLVLQGFGNRPDELIGHLTGGTDVNLVGFNATAKYPGTYGNQLKVRLKVAADSYGKKIGNVEVFDRNGYIGNDFEIVNTDSLVETVPVAFDYEAARDDRPMIDEAVFAYLTGVQMSGSTTAESIPAGSVFVTSLHGATDLASGTGTGEGQIPATPSVQTQIMNIVSERFNNRSYTYTRYIDDQVTTLAANSDRLYLLWNQQRVMQNAIAMLGELTDPLIYDWDAVFMGIADDQYVPQSWIDSHPEQALEYAVTTAHVKLFEVAANSKCGAAMVGTPFGMKRGTWDPATKLATGAVKFKNDLSLAVGNDLSTFGEVVGPWVKSALPISGANAWVTPEVGHLLLIINADGIGGCQRWWLPPAGMLGKGVVSNPEYYIKKGYLDIIQNHDEGVCLNPLMAVPGKGVTCFGNSTLWDKPLASYNALQNLSTRFLCNRVKQRVWDAAMMILFKYNNEDAYSHFYAALTPLLDEMKNLGALNATEKNPLGYRVIMNPDIINLDKINSNTVIGKVELAVQGVIDTVDVDIFLLPPNAFDYM